MQKNTECNPVSLLRVVDAALATTKPGSLQPDAATSLTNAITAWHHEHGQSRSKADQAAMCRQAVHLLCGLPEAPP